MTGFEYELQIGKCEIIDMGVSLMDCQCGGKATAYIEHANPKVSFDKLCIHCDNCGNGVSSHYAKGGFENNPWQDFKAAQKEVVEKWNGECKQGIDFLKAKNEKARARLKEMSKEYDWFEITEEQLKNFGGGI